MGEHWSLLFQKMKDANKEKFEKGDFTSVTMQEAIQRLRGIVGKEIDDKPIEKLRQERNRIIHFNSPSSHHHARALLLKAHGFVIDYVADNGVFEAGHGLEVQYEEIKRKISVQQLFVDKRLLVIGTDLDKFEIVIKCPECWQIALPLVEDDLHCRFCRTSFDDEGFTEKYSNSFMSHYWGDSEIWPCPDCQDEGAVFLGEVGKIVCLKCKADLGGYRVCEDCNELMDGIKYVQICGSCIQRRFDSDRMMPAPSVPED